MGYEEKSNKKHPKIRKLTNINLVQKEKSTVYLKLTGKEKVSNRDSLVKAISSTHNQRLIQIECMSRQSAHLGLFEIKNKTSRTE